MGPWRSPSSSERGGAPSTHRPRGAAGPSAAGDGFARALETLVIPDNLRSGVTRACRYEPELNPTYQDLAVHYGVAVMPARVRKPRDKAKVESGVQLVQRWILARLRHRQFFSLAELNQAIRELLGPLNDRPLPQAARLAPIAVREPRAAGSATAARGALHLRGVEEGAGPHRLPRRGRRPILQRALPAGEPAARRPGERQDRGVLREEQAGGEPSAQLSSRSAHDPERAHAAELLGLRAGAEGLS
jgi:hypothetical protein